MKHKGPQTIFCDFDGTITHVDGTDAVLREFASPAWREWEALWVSGEISSQECLVRQIELIQADRETVVEFASALPIDPGFRALVSRCEQNGVPFTILSDGLDLIVNAVLDRHGLLRVPHRTTQVEWPAGGRPTLRFPYASGECASGAGTCKCAQSSTNCKSGVRRIYIGDGRSDFCVAGQMDFVFAKGTLKGWCAAKGIAHRPFESLPEVIRHLFPEEVKT